MGRTRVAIRLRFTRLPNVSDERIFRDTLLVTDPDARSYQDLSNMVEKKLTFMEIPPCDFTVFFVEPSGDRVVVDDAYFALLMQDWLRQAEAAHAQEALPGPSRDVLGLAPSSEDEDDEWDIREVHTSFDIEVNRLRNLGIAAGAVPLPDGSMTALTPPSSATPAATAVRSVPLTVQNLAQLKIVSTASAATERASPGCLTPSAAVAAMTGEQLVTVGELQCPPQSIHFVLRCVLLAVRVKVPKPDLVVAELDLCDAAQPAQQITAVTFDAVVQRAIREHLRADRRQVIELRQVYVRRKTETDVRYQTNGHPLLLRLDRHSRMDVVQVLSTPVALPSDAGGLGGGGGSRGSVDEASSGAVVRVREVMPSGGVLELACGGRGVAFSSSSSSTQSVAAGVRATTVAPARRTTFTLSRGTSQGAVGGVATAVSSALVLAPADLGWQTRCQQERFLAQRPAQPRLPVEPGVVQVTSEDVRRREPLLQQQVNKEVERKERIRRRCGAVSASCLLCGLNCDDETACMPLVRRLLEANFRNKGRVIPTIEELRSALADHRRVAAGTSPTRLVCRRTFVNVQTRTVHIVHCRCAHLCTSYQRGGELEDIVMCEMPMQLCTLCGLPGATVSCYHPDCKEMYHTICALYSGGYVNFGKKDPYLPCPACPRHTLVNLKPKAIDDVLHVDTSCWDDGIAFDSRVVESTDLRDPDENDGA